MQDLESKQFLEGVTFQGKKKKKPTKHDVKKNNWTKDEPGRDLCKDSAVAWILSDFKSTCRTGVSQLRFAVDQRQAREAVRSASPLLLKGS